MSDRPADTEDLWNAAVSLSSEVTELREQLTALRAAFAEGAQAADPERARLERRIAELERVVERQARQVDQLKELRASPSYRLLRGIWRANAIVRSPLRRRALPPAPKALPPAAAPAATIPKPAPPPPAPATAPSLEEDRSRFLAASVAPARREPARTVAGLRIAAIVGEPLRARLSPACELMTFRPDNWRYFAEARPPHLLLVESTWIGNRRSWQYRVGEQLTSADGALEELVAWCGENGVPTVFWGTRPAAALAPFARAARGFDHVFAADPQAPLERAQELPLGVQPALYGPATGGRPVTLTYVGAFDTRLAERNRGLLEALLDAAPADGLRVLDSGGSPWPERLAPAVRRAGGEHDVATALGETRAVAGVANGAMVPGAYLDAVCAGAAVLCAPHPAAQAMLGEAIAEVADPAGARDALAGLLAADRTSEARAALLERHTYEHRLATIAAAAGIELEPVSASRR